VTAPVARIVDLLVPGESPQRAASANVGLDARLCDIGVHLADGLVHIELEPSDAGIAGQMPTVVAQSMVAHVNNAPDMGGFFQRCADQVRLLTGYDRVMVYRFRHDDAGEVLAESRDAALEPYLGLRFPASDIPEQARALYVRNRIRVIPDADYRPVPVLPARAAGGQPLDLSQHALRSVSPVHLEYLRNMGVQASMSVSIVVAGRLWGLIACHHRSARLVQMPVRAALDMFSMFVSMRVGSHELEQAAALDEQTREVREALALRMASCGDIAHALETAMDTVSRVLPSDGVALRCDGAWTVHGEVPDAEALGHALAWAQEQPHQRSTASSDAQAWCPGMGGCNGLAGLLAVPFGRRDDWLLFFRAEQVEDVTWAGDPHKPMVPTDDGVRIAPRKSFAAWRQTVRGQGVPWSAGDLRAAEKLRQQLQEHHWQPLPADVANVTDMDAFRRRHVLLEQKSRLDQLAGLLDGLGHLGDEQTTRIGERIAALEAEIRALMLTRPSEQA
jgi:light-regulated signal transduction histidine kinase (bacteriophytochrome)